MPTYRPLKLRKNTAGLNTRVTADDLDPGEANAADNVEFRNYAISKVRGYANHLQGDLDDVYKGGAPGASFYLQGDQRWLSDGALEDDASGSPDILRRDPEFHHRHALMIAPEFEIPELRANVQSGDDDWIIECSVWSDDLYLRTDDPTAQHTTGTTGKNSVPIVIMSKSGLTGMGPPPTSDWGWKIMIIPAATDDLTDKPYVTLRLQETGAASTSDFEYQIGAVPSSFITPGRRFWFAWKFSGSIITSYFWAEGATAAASSFQSVTGTLRTNGTTTAPLPLIFGGQALRPSSPAGAPEQAPIEERGFNGVVGEFRFWSASTGTISHPDWTDSATNWYFDREIEDENLLDGSNNWLNSDLEDIRLYYSLGPDYVDADDRRMLLPRAGDSSLNFSNNKGWLTGADAAWVSGGGSKIGNQALAFCPFGPATSNADAYHDPLILNDIQGAGGIRIPNMERYFLKRAGGLLTASEFLPYEFNEGYSFRVSFVAPTFETAPASGPGIQAMHLLTLGGRLGASDTFSPLLYLWLEDDSGMKIKAKVGVGNGLAGNGELSGAPTGGFVAGTEYAAVVTIQYTDGTGFASAVTGLERNQRFRLWVDGELVQQQEIDSGSGLREKGDSSSNSVASISSGDEVDLDGRGNVYFGVIGGYIHREGVGGYDNNGNYPNFGAEGAPSYGGSTIDAEDRNMRWSFGWNASPFQFNDGVIMKNAGLWRGKIGNVQIWSKELGPQEITRFTARAPDSLETAAYGSELLSNWDFEEGSGTRLEDKGFLGNDIDFRPYPTCKSISGPIHRRNKSNLIGFWEFRTRTPREGLKGRDLYGFAGGSILVRRDDSNGDGYLVPISKGHVSEVKDLPTAFQLRDFVYFVTGEGPVLRGSLDKVVNAGLSPVWGDRHNGELGWNESHRDGTFKLIETNHASAGIFDLGKRYIWAITFYDAQAAVESAPSRLMSKEILSSNGAEKVTLKFLPLPREQNVSNYRIYRTAANSGDLKFVDEIPITAREYEDNKEDAELGAVLESQFHQPPPLNARIGVSFGARAVYAGYSDNPGLITYSRLGFPEYVPDNYRILITSGRSSEVVGLHPMHDRTLVFMQDTVFALWDTGSDVSQFSLETEPLQISLIREDVGCVSHHGIVSIDGIGVVFPGERGLYRSDGTNFSYLSDKIETTWQGLDKSSYRKWHAVHWRKNDQYILFCSDGSVSGKNNIAIIWDYGRNAFSVRRNIYARYSRVIEDRDTGTNRLLFSDYHGQLWELDSEDAPVNNDGVGSKLSSGDMSGTVQSGSTTTLLDLGVTLPTDGDGLRGVGLQLTLSGGTTEEIRIIDNDANDVRVESAFSESTVGLSWKLGSIASEWRSGRHDLGIETVDKKVNSMEIDFAPDGQQTALNVEMRFDGESLNDSENQQSADATASRFRYGPKLGRGHRIQWRFSDDDPEGYWEISDIEINYWYRERSKWPV